MNLTFLRVIVDGNIYDLTKWASKHPGGPSIITDFAGQDATDAVHAMHPNLGHQYQLMSEFKVGVASDYKPTPLQADFRDLRRKFLSEGLFEVPLLVGGDTGTTDTMPSQVGIAIRPNRHLLVLIVADVIKKDPDLANEPLFIFHENMVDLGMGSKGTPYQARYWWIVGPPLITSVLFFLTNIYFMISRRLYTDIVWGLSFLTRTLVFGKVATGTWGGSIAFYFFMRCFESMWFSWVVSMNHFPMYMNIDEKADWVTAQLYATQNVKQGLFTDWFTGHLNFQIEHHLFPSMPRHNYAKISGRVKKLCDKYGLKYESKGLLEAFGDVVRALDRTATYYVDNKQLKQT